MPKMPAGARWITGWHGLGAALVVLLLAAACDSGEEAPPAGEGRHGGTAVQAIGSDPPHLNMALTTDLAMGTVGAAIYEGLVWVDQNFEPHPSLAESWEISDDGLTYEFKLREGVRFHDGEPLTSADVKFTFEEVLATTHPRMSATLTRLESIETPDDLTVIINLTEPFAPLILQLTVTDAAILPKHLFEGTDIMTNPHNDEPIGTGPFKFESWDRGSSIRIVRNDDYWDGDKPYLDEIVYQVIPDGVNRSTALETGEVDYVWSIYLPPTDIARLRTIDGVQLLETAGTPVVWVLHFNLESDAFSDVSARAAVAHAVDRERIVEQAAAGLAIPGGGAFGTGFDWLFAEDLSYDNLYPRDIETARDLLSQAGVPEGTEVGLVYDNSRPELGAAAEIIRENLGEIGLTVSLQPQELALMTDSVFAERTYDISIQSYTSSNDPAVGYHRLYLTTPAGTIFANPTGYSNPEADQLFAEAASELDLDRRAELYRELQDILNRDLPTFVLYDWVQIDGAASGLRNLGMSHESRDRWGEVYFADS